MKKSEPNDKPLRDLLEIIRFTESLSAKLHSVLDEAIIYRIVREEFARSKRYTASILLLTDDGASLRLTETSIAPRKLKELEKASGLQAKGFKIDLNKSSIYSKVVREGKTVQASVSQTIGEFLPQPVTYLISKTLGYDKALSILTPLKRQGKVVGAFAISSTHLSEYSIPSVENLALHISTALELACEYTERKQSEEALQQSQEALRKMLKSVTDGIVVIDLNGVITEVNQRAAEMHRFGSKDELLGKSAFKLVASRDHERIAFNMRQAVKRGSIRGVEYTLLKADGSEFLGELSTSVLKDASGNPVGHITVVRDITERKRMEEREKELQQELLLSSRLAAIGELVAGVARQINNPLTGIVGFSQRLLRKSTDEEARQDLEIMLRDLGIIHNGSSTGGKGGREMPLGIVKWQGPLTSLQERFIRSGFEGFTDQETVELLLSLALPHRECKKLAKNCIERFKNLRGFLTASRQELERVGITPRCMFCIKLLHELPAEVLRQKIVEQPVYKSSKEVFDYLYYSMRDLEKEVFKAIYLNSRNQIIDTADLFEGTLDSIPIRPREIVESAINHRATALIFAHNHPSGDPTPSKRDKQLTRDLVFVGSILQIKVLDHIIIGDSSYFSFADKGLIEKYEDNFLNLKIRGFFDTGVDYSVTVPQVSTSG